MSLPPFSISPRVAQASNVVRYQRKPGDPLYRPLRVFVLDPAEASYLGAIATINVPFEELTPGPIGTRFKVRDYDSSAKVYYKPVDLDSREVLISNGLTPSVMDPQSHQQMVYAVAMKTYETFRTALGRELQWGFSCEQDCSRLELRPHASVMENGFYDRIDGAIHFGYFNASTTHTVGRNLPGGFVFTSLSHDIIAHEVTHAVIDGLRPHFLKPTNQDVLAFHEGISDLIAVFQKFTYPDLVETALRQSRGELAGATLLTDVARQFGHTIGQGSALRSAIDTRRTGQGYIAPDLLSVDPQAPEVNYQDGHDGEPHRLGSVLLSAVFDAFNRIFSLKSAPLIRVATGGSGVLPPGELPADLLKLLAKLACELASQFLSICIRAIDYCPPVDITYGDFLRALITADTELVHNDNWGYRTAFIDAFRMRKIFPSDVETLAEESLRWQPLPRPVGPIEELSFAQLRFRGDPANPMDRDEQLKRADVVGRLVTDPRYADMFGLVVPGMHEPPANVDNRTFKVPVIESLRTARRIGPDGEIQFDLVVEVSQFGTITRRNGVAMPFYGGSTILIGPKGEIRYAITKSISSTSRPNSQMKYAEGTGRPYWIHDHGKLEPHAQPLRLVHRH